MKIKEALKQLSKHHNIVQQTLDVYSIEVQLNNDEQQRIIVAIKEIDGETYLTDYGYSCQYTNLNEEEIKKICKTFDVEFNNYAIQCKYEDEKDLANIIKCINKIL